MAGNGAEASYGDLLVISLVVLGVVCVAAFVVVRLVGRVLATGRSRGAHLLDVVARVPLEPRRSLYVVEVAGKTLLVGTSEMGLSVLSELDGAEVRARVVERPSFGDLVRTAWARRRGLRRGAQGDGEGEPRDGGGATAKDAPREAAGGVGEPRDGGLGGGGGGDGGAGTGGGGGGEPRGGGEATAKDAPREAGEVGEPREGGADGGGAGGGGPRDGGGAGPGGRTP